MRQLWPAVYDSLLVHASRPAISTPHGSVSFAELHRSAEEAALSLSRWGLGEERTTALVLRNTPAFASAYLALCRLSHTVLLVSPQCAPAEVETILASAPSHGILTTRTFAGRVGELLSPRLRRRRELRLLGEDLEVLVLEGGAGAGDGRTDPPAALVKFTSGSMGVPKGIVLSAANVLAEAGNVISSLGITADDRIHASVPLFHSYGFDLGVLPMLMGGATLLLRDAFVPRRTLHELSEQGVTVFLGTPSMYRFLLETSAGVSLAGSAVRYLLSCTAPLARDLVLEFHRRFQMPICQHYGSSETGGATLHVPERVLERPDSVGRAMNGVEIRILGPDGQALPPGEEGEVVVSGAAVARGYVSSPPGMASPFQGGAYWTGDLGRMDRDGFLDLVGRKDSVINVGGLKVSPLEVSRVLESSPAVREAAVAGMQDASGAQIVYAVVTLKAPATEAELLDFCRSRLADYKVPRRIEIRDEMPRSPTGKVILRAHDRWP